MRVSSIATWPRIVVAVVIIGCVAGSLAITAAVGSVPQNDDWSYVKAALILAREGRFELQGWGQMFQLGQLVTAQPLLWIFGERTASLEVYGGLAMIVWLTCVFLAGRQCVGERRALLLVVVIACWPGMALLASSFMTDGPSAAASLVSVVLGIAAITRESRALMAGCLLASLFAFTIREQLVVSIVAVVLGAWLTKGLSRRFRVELTVGTAVLVVVCAFLERLRHQMPNGDPPPFGFDTLNFAQLPPSLLPCLFTIGLAVSPLAAWNLLSLHRRDLVDFGRLVGWALGLLALLLVATGGFLTFPTVTLSNYITSSGAFPVAVVGSVSRVISPGGWLALQILAMLGGVAITGEAGARLRRIRSIWSGWRTEDTASMIMTVYTLLLVVFVIGLSFGGQRQFDRYLIALFPGAGLLLLRSAVFDRMRPVRRAVLGTAVCAATAFLAAIALVVTVAANSRDNAVWDAAAALRARGVPSTMINAGLNWNGYHSVTATDRPGATKLRSRYQGQHWINIFPQSRDCYVVTTSPMKGRGWRLLSTTVHTPDMGHAITTYTYRHTPCPSGEVRRQAAGR